MSTITKKLGSQYLPYGYYHFEEKKTDKQIVFEGVEKNTLSLRKITTKCLLQNITFS